MIDPYGQHIQLPKICHNPLIHIAKAKEKKKYATIICSEQTAYGGTET